MGQCLATWEAVNSIQTRVDTGDRRRGGDLIAKTIGAIWTIIDNCKELSASAMWEIVKRCGLSLTIFDEGLSMLTSCPQQRENRGQGVLILLTKHKTPF